MRNTSHESIVADQFDPQAQAYLSSVVHAIGADLDELELLIGARPTAAALDLGCGGGHVSFRIASKVARIVAYDLSPSMVALVKKESSRRGLINLEARQGTVERLPWSDSEFDVVVTRYSAHHWHNIPVALQEVRRVLKPGGLFVAMDVCAPTHPLLDTWLQSLELLRDASHVRDYSLTEWAESLRACGMVPTTTSQFKLRLEYDSWVKRIATPEPQKQAIRALQDSAASDVREYFRFESDGSFTVDTMLMTANG